MSQTGNKKVRRDGNVRYYKGKCFTKGNRGNRGIKDHDVGREWVMGKYES